MSLKMNQDSKRQAFFTNICNQMDAINLRSEDSEKKTGHFSIKRFIIQLQQLQDIHLAKKIKTGLMRMMTKFRGFLKKSTDCTNTRRYWLSIQKTATFVRQSRLSLGTCEIPGLGRSSLLRTERTWRNFTMH